MAGERRAFYQQRSQIKCIKEEAKRREPQTSSQLWQKLCFDSTKDRWTQRVIPEVDGWIQREHGCGNYYLIQMLTRHGAAGHTYTIANTETSPTAHPAVE